MCCSDCVHSLHYSIALLLPLQYSTAQHSTAQHSTAQHSTAQHNLPFCLRTSVLFPQELAHQIWQLDPVHCLSQTHHSVLCFEWGPGLSLSWSWMGHCTNCLGGGVGNVVLFEKLHCAPLSWENHVPTKQHRACLNSFRKCIQMSSAQGEKYSLNFTSPIKCQGYH